jgi:hypothetical protein
MPPRPIPVVELRGPLLLKRNPNPNADDYAVLLDAGEHGKLAVGRILLAARPGSATAYLWALTGPACPEPPVAPACPDAPDLQTARAAFRTAFDSLLTWAVMARDGEVRWLPS